MKEKTMIKDFTGHALQVGDVVARAIILGRSPSLKVSTVTSITDGKLYLDNSPQHIRHTDRLIFLENVYDNT